MDNRFSDFFNKLCDIVDIHLATDVDCVSQYDVKRYVIDSNLEENFPMICSERTDESKYVVDTDESVFLNSQTHAGNWLIIGDMEEPICICCLKTNMTCLEIDVFEISEMYRGFGYARKVVESIERAIKDIYDGMIVNPFDYSSESFWEHMGFVNYSDKTFVK